MTATDQLELLMQRAADGELSTEQRHELMELVEQHPDGWRQLACRFLEEQLVSRCIRQAPHSDAPVEESIVRPLTSPAGFWYRHPALTTAITIVLAFVLGLTVPWDRSTDGSVVGGVQVVREGDAPQRALPRDDEFLRKLDAVLRQLELVSKPAPGN